MSRYFCYLRTRRSAFHLITATCLLLASACAMSPQTIAIRPDLKVPTMPIGHGQKVRVETVDRRSDTTLGTLGGVYQSAYVSTDARMTDSITQETVKVLQGWDFVAMPLVLGDSSMDRFTIQILDFNYQRPTTAVAGNVTVKCRVAVHVERGSGTYTGEYQSLRSEQVAVMGTVEGNKRIINETISQALTQVFSDKKLQRFMAR